MNKSEGRVIVVGMLSPAISESEGNLVAISGGPHVVGRSLRTDGTLSRTDRAESADSVPGSSAQDGQTERWAQVRPCIQDTGKLTGAPGLGSKAVGDRQSDGRERGDVQFPVARHSRPTRTSDYLHTSYGTANPSFSHIRIFFCLRGVVNVVRCRLGPVQLRYSSSVSARPNPTA
jgi:hypothetical protein